MILALKSLPLSLAGLLLIACGLAMDLVSGQPLSIGWSQLFLIIAGTATLAFSIPAARASLARALAGSSRQSPATALQLASRPGVAVRHAV